MKSKWNKVKQSITLGVIVEHICEFFHYPVQSLKKHKSTRSIISINEALFCIKCYWQKLSSCLHKSNKNMFVYVINRWNKYAEGVDCGKAGNQINGRKI